MSLATILWILGGWFVLAAVGGLLIGRIASQNSLADLPEAADTPAAAERAGEQKARPSKVA